MKALRLKWIMMIVIGLISQQNSLDAECFAQDSRHKDQNVVCCWYTQKDLKKIRAQDRDRFKQMGIKKKDCFYCGCEVSKHSEE